MHADRNPLRRHVLRVGPAPARGEPVEPACGEPVESACGEPVESACGEVSPHHRHGFTLLEVLMALVVFALAAVVLGSAYLNVLNSYEVAARGMIINEEFAHARRILLTEPDRTKLEQGGEFETADGRHLTWGVEITSSSMPDLFNVALTCEIAGSSGPQPEGITQTFVLLRPTWSIDPAERGKLLEEAKTRILELQEGLVTR